MKDFEKYKAALPPFFTISKYKYLYGKKCCVSKCKKPKGQTKARGKIYLKNMCYAHQKKLYKFRNPLRYYYNNMKQNAVRRKKPFSLSFEQYCELWYLSGRLPHVVSDGKKWTVDRIDSSKGYQVGNVRIVDFVTNSSRILETDPKLAKLLGLDFEIVCIKNGISQTVIGEMDLELKSYLEQEYSTEIQQTNTETETIEVVKEAEILNLPF